jgi:signal transduction histidine kinase
MATAFEMTHEQDLAASSRLTFVAALAHDLRTPLMVLMGASDLLLRDADRTLTDEQRLLVEAMRRSTHALTAIVNSALAELNTER